MEEEGFVSVRRRNRRWRLEDKIEGKKWEREKNGRSEEEREREREREKDRGRGKALSSALLKSPFLPPFLKASYGTRGNCESTWKLLKSPTTLPWLSAASRQEAAATSHPVTETRTYCDYPSMCCNIATILCIKHRVPSLLPTVARRTPASQPANPLSSQRGIPLGQPSTALKQPFVEQPRYATPLKLDERTSISENSYGKGYGPVWRNLVQFIR